MLYCVWKVFVSNKFFEVHKIIKFFSNTQTLSLDCRDTEQLKIQNNHKHHSDCDNTQTPFRL